MSSPAAVAGIVIASIAGFFAVLAPFIIILLRRRRTSLRLQGHGAANFVWSHIDGAADYGKSFVESIALLNNTEQEVEDLSTRPYNTTGRHALLIDLSSAYGYGPVTKDAASRDATTTNGTCSSAGDVVTPSSLTSTTQSTESSETVVFGREAPQGATSHYVQESRREEEMYSSANLIARTDTTLIDISVDESSTTHLQRRAEMTTEALNGPLDHGSTRSKFAAYTSEEYEKALLEVATIEKIGNCVSQTTKKLVRKRSEHVEMLNGPVNHGSARSKFAAYTSDEYEKAMIKEAAMAPLEGDCDSRTTKKKTIRKRSEHLEEALNGPVNFGSAHVRGTRHTQEEMVKALMELQK
jgi:hypothetical protein